MDLAPNIRVRLKGDPSAIGFSTDRLRQERNRSLMLVRFTERDRWVPVDQLEAVPDKETPLDMLRRLQFGHSGDLRRVISHVRLTGRLADVIYSMEATNTDFYAYQFKPVLKLLLSPSNGILIADEVGLGKTIEAGLIWTELRSRFDFKRLLVVCPAMLREKWQDELENRMGVRAEQADAEDVLKALSKGENIHRGFALIASHQGLRPPRGWSDIKKNLQTKSAKLARFLQEKEGDENLVDLLIIDEAHYMRNQETQTNTLGRLLRGVSEYASFLSATPVHNRNKDLFSLLTLLDPDTFRRIEDFQAILEANAPLVEARDLVLSSRPDHPRLIELLKTAGDHHLLKKNRQLGFLRALVEKSDLSQAEQRSHIAYRLETVNLLGHAVTRTRKREVKEWRVKRDPYYEVVRMNVTEADFYEGVSEAISEYASERDVNEWFLLAMPQRLLTSSMPAAYRAWKERGGEAWESYDNDDNHEGERKNVGPLTDHLIHTVLQLATFEELAANDTKYFRLQELLSDFFKENPSEKVVLFSTFKPTLRYLSERLKKAGIVATILQGGMRDDRDEIIRKFRSSTGAQVLLSSEVGGEGIDLQFCRVLVNYDLPWNPMRVEQRIGRLDRLGQKAEKIIIWNLIYENTIDARIYKRLYEKLDLCRQSLGDFEAILGEEIRALTADLMRGHLTAQEQEERIDQTAVALQNLRRQEEDLEKGASQLVAYGDYILNQIQTARDQNRWIQDKDLRGYVLDYLRQAYPGGTYQQLQPDTCDYEITLSQDAKFSLDSYIRSEGLTVTTGLTRPGHASVRCRFQNKLISAAHERIEVISQFHPLVRFVSDDIEKRELRLRPAIATRLPQGTAPEGMQPGIYLVAGAVWSVRGLHAAERLVFQGTLLNEDTTLLSETESEKLAGLAAMHGQDWPQVQSAVNPDEAFRIASDSLFWELRNRYDGYLREVQAQNDDRIDVQVRNLKRHLVRQRNKNQDMIARHGLVIQQSTDPKQVKIRQNLIKAEEGKIRKLEDQVEMRTGRLEERRSLNHDFDEVCIALISVE